MLLMMETEPFGDERIDIAMAQLCSLYVNGHLKDGYSPTTTADFLHDWWKPKQPAKLPDDLLAAKLASMFAGLGWKPDQTNST